MMFVQYISIKRRYVITTICETVGGVGHPRPKCLGVRTSTVTTRLWDGDATEYVSPAVFLMVAESD